MIPVTEKQKACMRLDYVRLILDNLYKKAVEQKDNLKNRELISEALTAIDICQDILNVQKQLIHLQIDIINDKL